MRVSAAGSKTVRGVAPWSGDAAAAPAGVAAALTLDEHGMICDCDSAGEALFKYRRGELLRRHVSMLLPQLGQLELMRSGEINPRLRFLCHVGRSFQAVTSDGNHFAADLFLNVLDHAAHGRVSLIVRPAGELPVGAEVPAVAGCVSDPQRHASRFEHAADGQRYYFSLLRNGADAMICNDEHGGACVCELRAASPVIGGSLHVGIDFIDDEHAQLLATLEELRSQSLAAKGDAALEKALADLGRFIRAHFDLEERVLAKIDSGGQVYKEHCAAHRDILAKYEGLIAHATRGDSRVPAQVADLLEDWITDHIADHDLKIRDLLAAAEAES